MPEKINSFQGEYRFLSNFWSAEVEFSGFTYPTVEHAYQAAKTHDFAQREVIRNAPRPGLARRWGRSISPLRSDWEEVKLDIMLLLVKQKFSGEPLRSQLLATGDAELIEGNTWNDKFWGKFNGEGENHLGKILMRVREELG